MSEKEEKVMVADPLATYVKVRDMDVEQLKALPRYRTTLVKTKINGVLRYKVEIEVDPFIHVSCNITEAIYVNSLLNWGDSERRDRDGRFVVSKNCPVYLVKGVNADGSEFIFWQVILYVGRTLTGLFTNDQISTIRLLEKKNALKLHIVEKPADEVIVADSIE